MITVEAREVVLVPVSDVVEAELSPSSLLEQPETSNAILNIKTNQENKLFILILLKNVDEAGFKNHKFKLFNPIYLQTKTKNYNLPNLFLIKYETISKIKSCLNIKKII